MSRFSSSHRFAGILVLVALGVTWTAWWLLRSDEGSSARIVLQEPSPREAEQGPGGFEEPFSDASSPRVAAVDPERLEVERRLSQRGEDDGSFGHVDYTGRVLDETRRPVEGAQVELWLAGRSVQTGRTDRDGRFALAATTRSGHGLYGAAVYARDDRGHVAARAGYSFSRRRQEELVRTSASARWESWSDFGDLILGPACPLTVRVVSAGVPCADADVFLESGRHRAEVLRGRTATDGTCRIDGVPRGEVLARAVAGDLRGRTRGMVEGDEPFVFEIEMVDAVTVDVQVLEAATSTPVAGVDVRPIEQLRPPQERGAEDAFDPYWPFRTLDVSSVPTDEEGRTVLRGLDPDQLLILHVQAEGLRSAFPRVDVSEAGASAIVRLDPLPTRTVRFPLANGPAASPSPGAPLAVHFDPIPFVDLGLDGSLARIDGAELVVQGAPDRRLGGWVVADDGRAAGFRIEPKNEVGPPVVFRPPRSVRVEVCEGGRPVPTARVGLREGAVTRAPFVSVDGEGWARFDDVLGSNLDVQVSVPPYSQVLAAGQVDIRDDDAELRFELPTAQRILLRVRAGGVSELPGRLRIEGPARVLSEDPAAAELLLELRSTVRPLPPITLIAWGFKKARLPIQEDSPDELQVIDVDLERTGVAILHFTEPALTPLDFELQRWNASAASWGQAPYFRLGQAATRTAEGSLVFEPLPAGTYRFRERHSGLVLDSLDIDPERGPTERHFDPRKLDWVRGSVEADPPTPWTQVRIEVHAPNIELPFPTGRDRRPGHSLRGDGSFQFLLPTSSRSELKLSHPSISVDSQESRAFAAGGESGILLRLRAGTYATMEVPQIAKWVDVWGPGLRVELFDGDVEAMPRFAARPRVDGVVMRFGGFLPGRGRLWLDPGAFLAPLVRDVEFAAGANDLGVVTFSPGSRVQVELHRNDGQPMPEVQVTAHHLGRPAYSRTAASRKKAQFPLAGLGAGRFRITARIGAQVVAETELSVDGQQPDRWSIDVTGW